MNDEGAGTNQQALTMDRPKAQGLSLVAKRASISRANSIAGAWPSISLRGS